jgi:hypothetical protein
MTVHCDGCHTSVTVLVANWRPHQAILPRQVWYCPYCLLKNEGEFPGRLAWVTKGHDESTSQ